MPLRINNNVLSINTQRHLRLTNQDVSKRIERLASGLRVNRASDDAASLSISEGIRGQISGFSQSIRNGEQAANLVQTAEGSLNEVNGILLRMRELSVQSASSTVTDTNRQSLHAEFGQLVSEIDRIATATSYNNTTLLTGFGATVSQSTAASTALASTTTGVIPPGRKATRWPTLQRTAWPWRSSQAHASRRRASRYPVASVNCPTVTPAGNCGARRANACTIAARTG